jgi:gliding motility-associated-like protein
VVNISCTGLSDGRVSTTASGGVGGYTYSLNGSVFRTDSVFTGLAPGVYNLFVRDANGCVKSRIFRVVEPAPFVLTFFKVESAKCFGSADGIIEIRVEGGRLPYTYTWSHDPTLNAPIAEGLKAGVYTVSAVDSSGCSIASRTYTVPQPEQVQAGEDYAVCRLGAVPLGVFMLREGKPAGGFWRGPAVIDSSLGLVDSDLLPEFARLQYEYIVKNCRDTLQLDVTGAIIPIRTDTVCLNETRYKLPEARPDTGFWYYGPVFRNFTGFADLTDLTIGRNQLYYFNNGCLDTLQLYVVPPPVARIGTPPGQPDTLRFPAASFTFLNQTDTLETLDWFWRLASGDTTTRLNPTVRYEFGGVYRNWLVVRNRFGCSDSALKVVVVIDTTEIELPTAFTPNGDNRNDFWEVKGLDFKHHTVAFYSRWAGKIYSYTAQGNYSRWDGVTPDGTPIPEGTYGVTFDGFKTDGRRIYRAILVHVLR